MDFVVFHYFYEILVSFISFIVPGLALTIVYIKITIVLIRRNSRKNLIHDDKDVSGFTNSNRPDNQTESNRTKKKKSSISESQTKKATIMCLLCLITYICLWSPYHGLQIMWNILDWYNKDYQRNSIVAPIRRMFVLFEHRREILQSIGTLFAFLNPLIYCGMNRQWINAAKYLFGFQTTVETTIPNATGNRTFQIQDQSSSAITDSVQPMDEINETNINQLSPNISTIYQRHVSFNQN